MFKPSYFLKIFNFLFFFPMKVDGDDPLTDVEVPPISNQDEGEKHVRLKDATTPSRNQGKKLSDFYTR